MRFFVSEFDVIEMVGRLRECPLPDGLVGSQRYADRVVRNEALNHAGAALSLALAGLVAQAFGFPAAFHATAAVAGIGLLVWITGLRAQASSVQQKPQTPPADKAA